MAMEMKPVESRDIALVGYDKDAKLLEIAFRDGGVYHYEEVPEHVYEEFLNAESHGLYFRDHIKTKYPFTKGMALVKLLHSRLPRQVQSERLESSICPLRYRRAHFFLHVLLHLLYRVCLEGE